MTDSHRMTKLKISVSMQTTLPQFLAHLATTDRAALTIKNYSSDLHAFMAWFERTQGRAPQIIVITPLDIREYRRHLSQIKQLKPASINRHLAALRSYFNWAIEVNQVATNPLHGIKLIRQPVHAPRWLTRPEAYALLRAAAEIEQLAEAKGLTASAELACRDQAIIALMLHAGLRVSEVCALQPRDVTMSARSGWVVVRFGKGRKYREVPLNVDARKAVKCWLEIQPEFLKKGEATDKWLFVGQRGEPLQPRAVQRVLEKLAHVAHLEAKTVTPHTLRHTFGKNLVDTGTPLNQVAMLLGHDNLNTTAIYTTPSATDLSQAVDKIAWAD